MDRDRILTPRAVEGLIAEGQTIVIFEDSVLRLDSWLGRHPGGLLAILHMVGKEATDEIKAYHSASTCRMMRAFRIGRKPPGPWTNMTPPIRGGVFRKLEIEAARLTKDAFDTDEDEVDDDAVDDDAIDEDMGDDETVADNASDASGQTSATPLTPICSSVESLDKLVEPNFESKMRWRASASKNTVGLGLSTAGARGSDREYPMDPSKFTDWVIEQEVERELPDFPSLDPEVQQVIARKYQLLHQRVQDSGLYECPYVEYGKETARYVTLFSLFLLTLRSEWYMVSALFLGLFWHQIMFTAHDAGHRAITKIFVVDTLIGMFIADFCCGLSIGWWKSSHNVHHLVTNQPEHDPDIQNVPLFATCPSFFKSLHSSYYDFTFVWDAAADFMVQYQKYTYYPVMGVARFNLYLLSWLHVLSKKSSGLGGSKAWWIRPTEIAFMAGYWFVFGYCLLWRTLPDWKTRVAFVLVSHIMTMPLHVQITLSHWGMSTALLPESESFPQRQLRTTMDVDCPAWLDFIHGGLQFQAVHHLFPRLPRHNLRKAQVLVREFCEETGIPYAILGFVNGNRKVLGRLDEVADQLKIMLSCQRYMAETGESGLH